MTVPRALTALLKDGLAQRVSHGTAQLHSSHRYYLTKKGIAQAADVLDFEVPSDFVRDAYPASPAVAGAAAAPHGLPGLGVPLGDNPVLRRGRAAQPGGVPTQGAASMR